jgi:hypothetical protein
LIGHRYQITKPIVGIRETCQGRVLHTLLPNSMVLVTSCSEQGHSVHVDSAGVRLTLFQRDLVERATRVEAPEISESSSVTGRSASEFTATGLLTA